jgi:tol-pal system protein YbgF
VSALQLKKTFTVFATLALASGCYSTKMMEFTYSQLDTVKTRQEELLQKVDDIARRMDEERDQRLRSEAETALAVQQMRDALETLSYRIEDAYQLLNGGQPIARPVHPRQTRPDSSSLTNAMPTDTTAVGVADTTAISPPSDSDSDADKLFKGSYMDLTLGNYDLAVQGFKNFLVRYPGAQNLPNAHYYLAESYYALSRFLEAVAEYQSVIRDYPKSRFVPACYLKSGFCYQQLAEKQLADRSFRELISRYPRSEEAEQARVALQNVGG